MFVSTDVYLKRLMTTLEKVIAPEIESDRVRGQVFAVIDLINQLSGKIEYKPDLIAQDIEMGTQMARKIAATLETAGVTPPPELITFFQEMDSGQVVRSLALRARVEEMVSLALDLLHANQKTLDEKTAAGLDRDIRDYLTKVATRDLGLMKPPLLEKISRSKREK